MSFHSLKSALAMAVVAGTAILGNASPAQAVLVTYTTVGTFLAGGGTPNTTPGTAVYTAPGVVIRFNGVDSDTVDAPSQASFGQFDTTGTTATSLTNVLANFRLDIFQSAPVAGGPATFVGSLTGALSAQGSTANVQFTPGAALSQTITAGGTTTTYTIVEADRDPQGNPVQGRANLNPPSTQAGLSSVEGFITTTGGPAPIPEPSTLLMGALAAPAVLICLRRKGKITV